MPLARSLFAVALRLSGSRDDADDIVQETFLRAYRTFDNFEPGTNARAWLFTILRSIVRNRQRQSSRRPAGPSLEELELENAGALETTGWGTVGEILSELDRRSLREEIGRALDAMPQDWRWIVLLVIVEGLSYEEVGKILDCPVGTVASRLSRARRQLFDSLGSVARDRGLQRG